MASSWDAPDNETFFDNTLNDPFASGFEEDETAEVCEAVARPRCSRSLVLPMFTRALVRRIWHA